MILVLIAVISVHCTFSTTIDAGDAPGSCEKDECGSAAVSKGFSSCNWYNHTSWVGGDGEGHQATRTNEGYGCTYCDCGSRFSVNKTPLGAFCGDHSNDCISDLICRHPHSYGTQSDPMHCDNLNTIWLIPNP